MHVLLLRQPSRCGDGVSVSKRGFFLLFENMTRPSWRNIRFANKDPGKNFHFTKCFVAKKYVSKRGFFLLFANMTRPSSRNNWGANT
jgi:hypothetical protein